MASLTLTLPSGGYGPLTSAFAASTSVPAAGAYYLLKPYGLKPREANLTYQELKISFPGVPGVAIKRFGGRERFIIADLMLIGADDSAVETLKNTIMDALNALARYSVTVPGGTARTGCKLVAATPIDFEEFHGLTAMILNLVIQDLTGA